MYFFLGILLICVFSFQVSSASSVSKCDFNSFNCEKSKSSLIRACMENNLSLTSSLLAEERAINATDSRGNTALMWASALGHVEIVGDLLQDSEIEVNAVDSDGWTALMKASAFGHVLVVDLLLKHDKINVNVKETALEGRTALLLACLYGRGSTVDLLLKHHEIDVNAISSIGHSALTCALIHGFSGIAKSLLSHEAIRVESVDSYGYTCLIEASIHSDDPRIIELIMEKGVVDVNAVDLFGKSALKYAIRMGSMKTIEALRASPSLLISSEDAKAIEVLTEKQSNLLFEACMRNNVDGARRLLAEGVDVNCIDGKSGWSPLMLVAQCDFHQIVSLFLAQPQIKVNLRDRIGDTALIMAAGYGHPETVKLLLSHPETDVNLRDYWGRSALIAALQGGRLETALLLLKLPGIRISGVDQHGRTCLILAVKHFKLNVVESLLLLADNEPILDFDAVDSAGKCALEYAAEGDKADIVEALLSTGKCNRIPQTSPLFAQSINFLLESHRIIIS
jgi:ankyrin repeat domain-containing protein 50